MDGLGPNESQIALGQFPPQGQNAALQADLGLPSLLAGRMRLILKSAVEFSIQSVGVGEG
jgi:hypothetical protein